MTTVNKNFVVRQGIEVNATANVTGATAIANTIAVTGNATFSNTFAVTGATTFSNTITTSGEANVASLKVIGAAALNGAIALGDATSDIVSITASVNTNIIPVAGNTYSLGNTTQRWSGLWTNTITSSAEANVASLKVVGGAALNGTVALGDNAVDNISVIGSVNTNIVPVSGTAYSLGNTSQRWSDVWANNVTATTNVSALGISARDLVLTGNLTVSGTLTTINTTDLNIGDAIITLNADLGGAVAPTEDAGFTVNRGSSANVSFLWDETNDRWKIGSNAIFDSETIHTGPATFSNTIAVTGLASLNGGLNAGTTNATSINVGANVNLTSVRFSVGNTTVNTFITSTTVETDGTLIAAGLASLNAGLNTTTANATSINVGANVNLTGSSFNIGNTTVNTFITSTAIDTDGTLTVLGSTVLSNTLNVTGTIRGSNSVNAASYTIGSTFIANTNGIYHTGAINGARITTGAVNGNATGLTVTGTLDVSDVTTLSNTVFIDGLARLNAGLNTTTANATSINVGANVTLSTSRINVGNSTVNSFITATAIAVDGTLDVLGATTLSNTLNVTGDMLGSSIVNAASHTVGTEFIANTTGVYHTGTINAASVSTTTSTITGNLNFTGTGNRITGDFSNATVANRVLFQTSTVNGASRVGILPNGTSPAAELILWNNSDTTNAGIGSIRMNQIGFAITSTYNGTGTYLPMTFYTGGLERLRVSTAGGFSVGTTVDPGDGAIYAIGNITAFYSSDRKLKENIKDVDNALEKVCAIGSKTFDWTEEYIKSKGGEDKYFMQKSDFGVIAQDVQEVFPQAVRTRPDGTLAVDYEKLATLAFGAIKELVRRIEVLEAK